MSVSVGDLVRYVRPYPPEAHLVYQVADVKVNEEGSWVLLVEEVEEDVEVAPGVMGGFGCWEESKEFAKVQ
tara:strand:+ start:147 stop:359 length:213 start_codon:yes stop_codon:yes gene_type:complete